MISSRLAALSNPRTGSQTCASSSSSTMVPVPLRMLIPLPFHSLNTKDSAAHFSMISASPTWILSCLSAPSVISSMSYSHDRRKGKKKRKSFERCAAVMICVHNRNCHRSVYSHVAVARNSPAKGCLQQLVVNFCALKDRDSGRLKEKLERSLYCFWRRHNQEKNGLPS